MIEHEAHSHARHTGLPWLDLILAASAIFISLTSLFISIQHGHTMEKLVAANEKQIEAATLPILRFSSGNMDVAKGKPAVHFDVTNGGTGPAIIEWFRLFYNGKPTQGFNDWIDQCCRTSKNQHNYGIYNTTSGITLPAGQSQTLAYIDGSQTSPVILQRAQSERSNTTAQACYCSVLKQCWITDFNRTEPKEVKSCPTVDEKQEW